MNILGYLNRIESNRNRKYRLKLLLLILLVDYAVPYLRAYMIASKNLKEASGGDGGNVKWKFQECAVMKKYMLCHFRQFLEHLKQIYQQTLHLRLHSVFSKPNFCHVNHNFSLMAVQNMGVKFLDHFASSLWHRICMILNCFVKQFNSQNKFCMKLSNCPVIVCICIIIQENLRTR